MGIRVERRRACGYSLTEAVLVMGVASVIMLIGLPNAFALYQHQALRAAAYEVAQMARQARMTAVAANVAVGLRARAGDRAYQLVDGRGAPLEAERYLPGRVRFESLPRTDIRFHPRGTAAPAGTWVLAGESGRARVIVNPAGRVRVQIE